jgi:hypothetical protein
MFHNIPLLSAVIGALTDAFFLHKPNWFWDFAFF